MATERPGAIAPILLAGVLLTWPALWNRYPLVFSDTGTYLSQAIEHYAGWDRPIFYSLFLLPLHLTLTTWPVIAAQALLTAHTLHLARRTLFADASDWWLVPLAGVMATATALPWFVAQLMPDVFTGLLVLALILLILLPERLSPGERLWLVAVRGIHDRGAPVACAAGVCAAGCHVAIAPMAWRGCAVGRPGRAARHGTAGARGVRDGGGECRCIRPRRDIPVRQCLRAGACDLRRPGPRRAAS